jgi:hypothetical protein
MSAAISRLAAAPLASRVSDAATASEVAITFLTTWREVELALLPIIGQRGLAALYNRSVQLGSAEHGWLAAARHDAGRHLEAKRLTALFTGQSDEQARAGASQLLQSFHDLLTSLIGAALTTRLLQQASAGPAPTPSPETRTP